MAWCTTSCRERIPRQNMAQISYYSMMSQTRVDNMSWQSWRPWFQQLVCATRMGEVCNLNLSANIQLRFSQWSARYDTVLVAAEMLIIVYTKETAYSGLYTCFHKYLVSTRCAKGSDGFIIVLKVDVGHEYMQTSDDSEICDNGMLDAPKVSDMLSIAESLWANNVTMNRRADAWCSNKVLHWFGTMGDTCAVYRAVKKCSTTLIWIVS